MDEALLTEQDALLDQVTELIEGAQTIAICAHTSPDGDAIGSALGLAEVIGRTWPDKQVTNLLADPDVVPRTYQFLPGSDTFVHVDEYDVDPDLFICVDLSNPSRLNEGEKVLARASKVAVLDHHPSQERFWDAGVVRPEAAAAGVIVAEYASRLGCLTPTIAQNLLCAIVTDTGRFQYQNADPESFRVASMLVDAGASPAEVAVNVYQSDRLAYLHLCATVMGRITTFEQGKIAYSYVTDADFRATGVPIAECDGLVDLVRCVEGSEVALFLKQVPGGKVRGNLRSKSNRDISGVAKEMGGGGHVAAAGFTVEGDIDQALSIVLPKLRGLYKEPAAGAGACAGTDACCGCEAAN